MPAVPSLTGATCLSWLGFRRALGPPNSRFTVTRFTGINSPAECSFAGSTPQRCIFDYSGVQSDLTHFSHNTYHRLLDGSLVVHFPGHLGVRGRPCFIMYTPINEVSSCPPSPSKADPTAPTSSAPPPAKPS